MFVVFGLNWIGLEMTDGDDGGTDGSRCTLMGNGEGMEAEGKNWPGIGHWEGGAMCRNGIGN